MATKTKTRKKTSTKKPSWSVTSYKKIEARRAELGLSKSAMAKALGVTNSTYHNWRRGTTVPHATQQEAIVSVMAGLTPGVKPTTPAPTRATRGRPKGSKTGRRGASKAAKAPRTGSRATGHVGMKANASQGTPAQNQQGHPLYPANPDTVRGIAQITAAYISAQKGAPSAGSVFKFVRGLRSELEGTSEG